MKIVSRNVNGIRAVLAKGFCEWIKDTKPDIICLQEVKAFENQIPPELRFHLADYEYIWHHGVRPGYAGTAIFFRSHYPEALQTSPLSRFQILAKKADFDDEMFHEDGRITQLDFKIDDQLFSLLNIYFPNGGTRADGTEMLTYKLLFYAKYRAYIQELEKKGSLVISTGDFNICHRPIDIARPDENKDSIGFLPIERAEMDKMEMDGLIDVFRYFNPDLADQYTWWSYRAGARQRNVGWRLDYFWVSSKLLSIIKSVQHQTFVYGSDHCPIVLEI